VPLLIAAVGCAS